jgi:phosphoribosylamine--glycine ligase
MKVLLIGSGGREHSLAVKLSQSAKLTKLFIAPGNPGTTNVPLKINDLLGLLTFAQQNQIDLTVVGPEAPLAMGIVDLFTQNHLAIIGPTQAGAQLESSKSWAKNFYKKYAIPSAGYEVFSDYESAVAYLQTKNTYPIVIKADGLAAGKGVTVAQDAKQAQQALADCFLAKVFAQAGNTVVIEGFLKGQEASVLAFTDGKTILPMIAAQDHKAIYDNDLGPNTGGMGAYAPARIVTEQVSKQVYTDILQPLLKGFQAEGITYQGILYAGLMIDEGKPSVVEFNVRFGDPETQVVLPLLQNDLLEIFMAIATKRLDTITLKWHAAAAVCVVLAAPGYPAEYQTNLPISITPAATTTPNVQIIHAGTKLDSTNHLVSSGGRIFGIVGIAPQLQAAIQTAYQAIPQVTYTGKYFRTDIGKKGI